MNSRYTDRIEKKLREYLPESVSLSESMRYSILDCGKRFRPILTYTVCDLFGEDLRLADSSACAVEMIHAYSLIHDDLPAMDDDDTRHSKPSCHIKFGEAQAILTGDALQALAFEVIAIDEELEPDVRIECIQQLSRASFEMALGQSIDMSIVNQSVDVSVINDMHQQKTGALLNCAVKLGALISSKCNASDTQILDLFSRSIGLAYQIQDDVLDVLVHEDMLGKKQNSDKENRKPTYPSLMGLDESQQAFVKLYEDAINSLEKLSVNADQLVLFTNQLRLREF